MTQIVEDYVSFEVAKLLKDKGFNEKVLSYYDTEGQGYFISPRDCNIGTGSIYAAPTLQMAIKWLRRIHNVNIDIVSVWNQKRFKYQVFVVTPENAKHCYVDNKLYLDYEKAQQAALKYCLENLI